MDEFRARWSAFMEGGWEKLLLDEADRVEAVRLAVRDLIPTHPKAVSLGDLLAAAMTDVAGAESRHLLAALLDMERHGHVECVAGWIYRPQPRVPRRGTCVEDMYFKFGCKELDPERG